MFRRDDRVRLFMDSMISALTSSHHANESLHSSFLCTDPTRFHQQLGSELSLLQKERIKRSRTLSQIYLGSQLARPCRIMSCNPNAPLELAAANRSLQRQEESRTECLMRHFAALQGSPLPDCCCENPDRACRSERSGNAAASWCKTNSLFMPEC